MNKLVEREKIISSRKKKCRHKQSQNRNTYACWRTCRGSLSGRTLSCRIRAAVALVVFVAIISVTITNSDSSSLYFLNTTCLWQFISTSTKGTLYSIDNWENIQNRHSCIPNTFLISYRRGHTNMQLQNCW